MNLTQNKVQVRNVALPAVVIAAMLAYWFLPPGNLSSWLAKGILWAMFTQIFARILVSIHYLSQARWSEPILSFWEGFARHSYTVSLCLAVVAVHNYSGTPYYVFLILIAALFVVNLMLGIWGTTKTSTRSREAVLTLISIFSSYLIFEAYTLLTDLNFQGNSAWFEFASVSFLGVLIASAFHFRNQEQLKNELLKYAGLFVFLVIYFSFTRKLILWYADSTFQFPPNGLFYFSWLALLCLILVALMIPGVRKSRHTPVLLFYTLGVAFVFWFIFL